MLTIYTKDGKVEKDADVSVLNQLSKDDCLWIDLLIPTDTEKDAVEKFIGVNLLTREEAEEIETTSRFSETRDAVISNSNFFIPVGKSFLIEPASFIITNDGMLISIRHSQYQSFSDTVKKLEESSTGSPKSGIYLYVTLLEARVDHDSDMVEELQDKVAELSKEISSSDNIDKSIIRRIISLQDMTMALHENIYDFQRVLTGIMRSDRFPKDIHPRLQMMQKDLDSLTSHTDFGFQRLDYMQDTALGLINIEQNEIVKILSVAAVIFMPPTLVASIYGMNFKYMPELDWAMTLSNGWIVPAGYLFALALMVIFTLLTLWFFKYKKWL